MKLSLQEGLYKEPDFRKFLRSAKAWGFDAVEVWGEGLRERLDGVAGALKDEDFIASSVCPGGGGIRGSLLSENRDERERAAGDIACLIDDCARLGGAGLVLVPEFGEKKFMSLYPDLDDFERRKTVFVERLDPLAERAERLGVKILLEPLNRYEAFFLLTLGQAADICRMAGRPSVRVMADIFHAGIEEDHLEAAVARNAEWIGHVHLVDTNRKLPGLGDRDFSSLFNLLKKVGFNGYLCMECGIPGDPSERIPESIASMRSIIEKL